MINYEELSLNTKWLTPAEIVFKSFGGGNKIAKLLNINRSMVFKWRSPQYKYSISHGRIPSKHQYKLLQLAKVMKIDLSAEDLICGRIQ